MILTCVFAVQKKHGQRAEAMNSAELAAMLDHAVLPTQLRRRLDAQNVELGSAAFDERCKEFAKDLGIPHLWYVIMYPFPLSVDNCKKHPWARKLLLRPRVNAEDWQLLEDELQQAEDSFVMQSVRDMLEERDPVFAASLDQDSFEDAATFELLMNPQLRKQCLDQYEQQHNLPYKMRVLRDKMVTQHWLRIVLPHQFMPLTPITPDIHQAIEHRVAEVKLYCAVAAWRLIKDGKDMNLLSLARTWQEFIIQHCRERSGPEGRAAIVGSINHMLNLLRILRAQPTEFAAAFKYGKGRDDGTIVLKLFVGRAGAYGPSCLS